MVLRKGAGGPVKSGTPGPVRGGSNFMQRGTGPYGGMTHAVIV